MDANEPTPQEIGEAAVEVAAVAAALDRPTVYPSARKGPEPIDSLNATHASRAAALVRRGERPGGPPMARALERQTHKPGADKLRG